MGYSIYKLAGIVGKTIEDCLVGGFRDCLHVIPFKKPHDFGRWNQQTQKKNEKDGT